MRLLFAFALILYFIPTPLTINSTCSVVDNRYKCPPNSFCNQFGYCQCESGFVLDCQTKSTPISSNFTTFQINSTQQYFTIVPSEINTVYVYKIGFCIVKPVERIKYILTLYTDEGNKQQFNKNNKVGFIELMPIFNCVVIFSPYMSFQMQENGQPEQMVLSIQVKQQEKHDNSFSQSEFITPPSQSSESQSSETQTPTPTNTTTPSNTPTPTNTTQTINETQKKAHKIQLKFDQIFVVNFNALWVVTMVLISVFGAIFSAGIAYLIYYTRRNSHNIHNQRTHVINNISFFNELMPIYKIKDKDLYLLSSSCPVCLVDFKLEDKIRRTICNHNFHGDCLDQWCRQNLSCPVCRRKLSRQEIIEWMANRNGIDSEGCVTHEGENQIELSDFESEANGKGEKKLLQVLEM